MSETIVAKSVVITGMGVVSPLGVSVGEVWQAIESRRSGVTRIDDMAEAGWIAPFGGKINDFDAKAFVKPRKSLKVMADEIQWAFAAGEQAWEHAGLLEAEVDPERIGVVCGAGLLYCDMDELVAPYRAARDEQQQFVFEKWGANGIREMFPLWMLKYLPNMSACHIGIRRDARGPTNTVAHGDASSLLALAESVDIIRRGDADIMITGGSSRRLHMTDPLWHAGAEFWKTGQDPTTASRPFDTSRVAPVCGEGSAMFVVESAEHAHRRGVKPIAEVLSVASQTENNLVSGKFEGSCIAGAIAAALSGANLSADELGYLNAHGAGSREEDLAEAQAIRSTVGDTLVTAPKSYFGNLGAAGGALELLVSLAALDTGVVPPTINHTQTDPACEINVAVEATPTEKPAFASVNYNTTGQAVCAVLTNAEA